MVVSLFSEDSYLFESPAKVVTQGVDESGHYLILDRTIFYPQGGGQPSDVGVVKCGESVFKITGVRKNGDLIKHYAAQLDVENLDGTDCFCVLDKATRILHMRHHTAGHLVSNVAEFLYPEIIAMKAHCFPGEAYVEFQGTGVCESDEIGTAIMDAIKSDSP
ncbi:MAG: hypothetical protein LBB18_01080, partial [Puniceicoccales bacterium]|nr:hypothetical protein [Puniceicoccales bacterium]